MSAVERIHAHAVASRRVRNLARHIEPLLPPGASVLDVGCGDGQLAFALLQARPDLVIRGVDVLVRDDTPIEVERFDGEHLPAQDDTFDVVLFVDVLHHTDHATKLLHEAKRVARQWVVLKDHTLKGVGAGATLRFMDRVGNARHGVALPYHYWTEAQWHRALADEDLAIEQWQGRLGLYPFPANLAFDRGLHFVARLSVGGIDGGG